MNVISELTSQGFRRLASLNWHHRNAVPEFEFIEKAPDLWKEQNVIYAYVDVSGNRFLNIGHTGQPVRARIGDYQRWLNGLRKNDCETPIRYSWLNCLKTCIPGKVEVWLKPSHSERKEREQEETKWIGRLRPILNRR